MSVGQKSRTPPIQTGAQNMHDVQRQFRFIFVMDKSNQFISQAVHHLEMRYHELMVEFIEFVDDPVSVKLTKWLNGGNVPKPTEIFFTDEHGNYLRKWEFDEVWMKNVWFEKLDYSSPDPVRVVARLGYKNFDLCEGFCTVPQIQCECGADKTNTTHSSWCPKHV